MLGLWLATIPSFKVLLGIHLMMGVVLTLTYWSALIKIVRQLAPSDQQGRYFGILEGGRNLTAVIFVAAGLYLLGSNSTGLRWAIILFSGELLAIGVLSWVWLPETSATGATAAGDKGKIPVLQAIGSVVRIPAVWLAMLVILCAYVTSVGITYLTPYATDVYGQSVVFGGTLQTTLLWTGMFASPLAGLVADRWTTSRTIVLLLLGLVLCWSMFVIVSGGPHLSVLLLVNSIVIGIIIYALRGIYYALLEEGAVPVALTGMATGLISMLAYTPDVFVPALAGHLLDRYSAGGVGYRYLFLILAMFSVAGVGLTLLFRHRISGRPARVSNLLIAEVRS